MTRDEIVAALRCISTPGDHCTHCESCPFWQREKLAGEMAEWEGCDVDAIGFAAADLIENQQNHIATLMKVNDSLKDAIARRDEQIEGMKQGMAQYEDTSYTPDEIAKLQGDLIQRNAELLKAREDARAMRNELCGRCGLYLNEHNGACDGCRWREK